ncbi:hypothetical protein ACQE98_00355 [Ornithinimicrobium sp. W1679]|uniref:hypothetical protein n=1 Tax=Ornithinimicrobium sp. W1679 TaxID=3418770 RepID=UPI003CF07622
MPTITVVAVVIVLVLLVVAVLALSARHARDVIRGAGTWLDPRSEIEGPGDDDRRSRGAKGEGRGRQDGEDGRCA